MKGDYRCQRCGGAPRNPFDPEECLCPKGFLAPLESCKGCGKPLDPANYRIADGCPCNSKRGINHGLVARETCTCGVCDPAQTGSTRYPKVV